MEEFFKISYEKQDYRYEMKNEHYHDYYEFYYLMRGARKMFIKNKVFFLHNGDIVPIQKGTIHRTSFLLEEKNKPQDCERIAIAFQDTFIDDLLKSQAKDSFELLMGEGAFRIPEKRKEQFEELLYRMLTENKSKDLLSHISCKLLCEEMLIFLIRCRQMKDNENIHELQVQDDDMVHAVEFINQFFYEPIDLELMAEKCSMSDSHFSKKFKKSTGFGFKEYLNTVRIQHACKLLLETNLSITEISEKCGYMDSNYFGDAFKKMKKMSPREYRKAHII